MTVNLNDIYEKLGKIDGTLSSYIKQQVSANDSFNETLQEHNERIENIESIKHKAVGVALGAGVFSGGVFATAGQFIGKLFNP